MSITALANRPNLVDANRQTTKALPAAGASADHDGIDLGTADPKPLNLQVRIDVPATPDLVDTEVITFTLEDSADDATYAAIDPAVTDTNVVGVATDQGGTAVSLYLPIPANCRRYIRVNQAIGASGGANTAISTTVSVVS